MKRLVFLTLFLTVLLGISSVMWAATITVGSTGFNYTTIQAAIDAAAATGDEIVLHDNFTIAAADFMSPGSYALWITDKALTLDLNGHTISAETGSTISIGSEGSLVLKDDSVDDTGKVINTSDYAVSNYGLFTMNGGTLESNYMALYNCNNMDENPTIPVYGTAVIEGGTLTGEYGLGNCGIMTISGSDVSFVNCDWDIDNSGMLTITKDLTINTMFLKNGEHAVGVTDAGTLITETDVQITSVNNDSYILIQDGATITTTAGGDNNLSLIDGAAEEYYYVDWNASNNMWQSSVANITQRKNYETIQAAINAANDYDVINVAAGTYTGPIDVNKNVSIIGAGITGDESTQTIITGGVPVVSIAATGTAANPLLLKDLKIVGATWGIKTATTPIEYLEFENLWVKALNQNSGEGFRLAHDHSLSHWTVTGSIFEGFNDGIIVEKSHNDGTIHDTSLSNVTFTDCFIKNNYRKGMYVESLSDATFTRVIVTDNGVDNQGETLAQKNAHGIEINLKDGAYSNLTFNDMTFTGNGLYTYGGGALSIKARDDGIAYGANPATLDNVVINGGTYTNNERGIRFGEPHNDSYNNNEIINTSPTNVTVHNALIYGNTKRYAGIIYQTNPPYGDLINTTPVTIDATNNYWGAENPDYSHPDFDYMVRGKVIYSPYYEDEGKTNLVTLTQQPVTNTTMERSYNRIQAALDGAWYYNVIEVGAGTYNENLKIHWQGITLKAADNLSEPAILDGGGVGSVVTISGNEVTVKNFTIQNSGPGEQDAGVFTNLSGTGVVTGNIMKNNSVGVHAAVFWGSFDSPSFTFSNNTIQNSSRNGIQLLGFCNSIVEGNTISASVENAILVSSMNAYAPKSTENTIVNNIISENSNGIYLDQGCTNNVISSNDFSDNNIHVEVEDDQIATLPSIQASNNYDSSFILGNEIVRDVVGTYLYVDVPDPVISNNVTNIYSVKATEIVDLRSFTVVLKIPKADFVKPVHLGEPLVNDFKIGSAYDEYTTAVLQPIIFSEDNTNYIYEVTGAYWSDETGINTTQGHVELLTLSLTSKPSPYTNVADGCFIKISDVTLISEQNLYIECTGTIDGWVLIDGQAPVVEITNIVDYSTPVPYIIQHDGNGMIIPEFDLTYTDNYDLATAKYLIQDIGLDAPNTVAGFATGTEVGPVNGILTDIDSWPLPIGSLADGTYTIYFLVVDEADNFSILDWDFVIDNTVPIAIVWDTEIPCRTTIDANNSIDLKWANADDVVKNNIWILSYGDAGTGYTHYPEYENHSEPTLTSPDPYGTSPQNGWVKYPIPAPTPVLPDTNVFYPLTGMARGYYYVTIFAEDASGNMSAAPAATFYRESISYWPGDVTGEPIENEAVVNLDDKAMLSAVWGLTSTHEDFNPIIDVGPSVERQRRGRPTPDGKINIEDLMMFAMNYQNTDYDTYTRGDAQDDIEPIKIEMQSLIAGNLMTVNLYLSDNLGQLKGLNIPLQFGSGLTFEALENGNIWPEDSMMLYTIANNVLEISASTLGQTGLTEDNGLIATLSFRIQGQATDLELLSMIARDNDNSEIEILGNPNSGPTDNEDLVEVIPTVNFLGSNYPNPFNPTTTIQFGLKQAQNVKITIYNTRGQTVKHLVNGVMPAGTHKIVWDGRDNNNQGIASGMYFYRMETPDYSKTNKAILMK